MLTRRYLISLSNPECAKKDFLSPHIEDLNSFVGHEDKKGSYSSRLLTTETPNEVMKRSKTVGINLLLMVSSILFALGLAEVSRRLFRPQSFMAPQKPTGAVWQELLHRPSPIPGLAYELTPNMTKFSLDALIRTNSHGMRDQEPIPMEDSSVFRIVVLGDSFTFGFGVENDETYPNVLEDLLNQSHASEGQRLHVLNFGVGGDSTRDEAHQL